MTGMTRIGFSFAIVSLGALALLAQAQSPQMAKVPDKVAFFGPAQSNIAAAVALPANRATFWTSGTVPPIVDSSASAGSRERYGDTKTQALGVLKNIEDQLKAQGLSLKDVIYLRVYVVPDPHKDNKPDFRGWFEAYAEKFANAENPTKVARSTLAVPALVNPDWLIEIEAVAVYPGP